MKRENLSIILDARRSLRGDAEVIAQRQRARLAEIVTFARTHSPYYREHYQRLPDRVEEPALLPVTDKKRLMARFDEWCTDRDVTLAKARAFAENLDLIGERFLDRYILATTSGTTGTPGIFIMDERSSAVTNAMMLRMLGAWLGFGDVCKIILRGGRLAMNAALTSHSATSVAAARMRKSPSRRKRLRTFSVQTDLREMVEELNRFQPAVLAPYASVAKLLGAEREAGRLNIAPSLIVCAAEGLAPDDYGRIARAFNTKVGNSYAATECPFLSYSCEHGWLHVNTDWVVLEPVDADYQPVPPGEQSHTVLISNLANRVQPVLRYDLGDSIVVRLDPCPCGNPLPAIRVQGRAAEVLTFSTKTGQRIDIPPLALEVDHVPGVERFQIVQHKPEGLRVRLQVATGAESERVWQAVRSELAHLLAAKHLDHVSVERADEPPRQSRGGKFRTVIPLGAVTENE